MILGSEQCDSFTDGSLLNYPSYEYTTRPGVEQTVVLRLLE
jgi:hypothetical protein